MENGSTAGVIVWENRWAAPFASAARRAGGQLIASGRIPIQAIAASLEADERRAKEPEMPLRPRRAVRRAVIAAPVARTAAAVGTAAVVGLAASTGVRTAGRTGASPPLTLEPPLGCREPPPRLPAGLVERSP